MTILGVSTVSEKTVSAQRFGGEHFFVMEELSLKTGEYLADLLNVEDALVVSSASAGIAQSVAAVIGRGSLYHALHPYDPHIKNREVIIPKGHNVDYGAPVEVMVTLGGGRLVEAGYANMCSAEHLEMMVTEQTAAVLYIKSHHAVQKSMISVSEAVEIAKRHHIPLIVDAAAEEDLFAYVEAGADLVIYSGAKAIEGPSSGLVIGKKELISWVRLQAKGIGRSMKIGKENILGLTEAVEDYLINGSEDGESMKARLSPFVDSLNTIDGISARVVRDAAGRDIYRASIEVSGNKTAEEVTRLLKDSDPAVYTREYQVNNGIFECDIRSVNEKEMAIIADRLKQIMSR